MLFIGVVSPDCGLVNYAQGLQFPSNGHFSFWRQLHSLLLGWLQNGVEHVFVLGRNGVIHIRQAAVSGFQVLLLKSFAGCGVGRKLL